MIVHVIKNGNIIDIIHNPNIDNIITYNICKYGNQSFKSKIYNEGNELILQINNDIEKRIINHTHFGNDSFFYDEIDNRLYLVYKNDNYMLYRLLNFSPSTYYINKLKFKYYGNALQYFIDNPETYIHNGNDLLIFKTNLTDKKLIKAWVKSIEEMITWNDDKINNYQEMGDDK